MVLILFVLYLLQTAYCKTCVDDVKVSYLHIRRLFALLTGSFNCDEQSFCANQTQIKGKVNSTGCFDRGDDDIKCCCNEAVSCFIFFLVHMRLRSLNYRRLFSPGIFKFSYLK
uniref:Secreted protein n=1 Tax=Parascaris equorum TaxID=6256 RepID=A0A914R717_PAREQ